MREQKIIKSYSSLAIILAVVSTAVGCRARSPRTSDERATPEQRRVIGAGVPYLPARATDKMALAQNMQLRREKAWDVIRELTKEVPIAHNPGGHGSLPNASASLPLWQTWYTGDELPVMFRSAYEKLTVDQRKIRAPICPEELDSLFEKHAQSPVLGFTPEELEQRLSQVESLEEIRGISGRGVTMFSPGLLRHYFENYVYVLKCEAEQAGLGPQTILSPSNHTPCFASEFPSGLDFPYKLPPSDYSRCKVPSAPGPGINHGAAVALKTSWRKAGAGVVGKFDTDGESLTKHLTEGAWKPNSLIPAQNLKPDAIFSIKLMASANQYNLESIHVVSKETRDWLWITLWWSPEPNLDFGEDRPAAFAGTPWANYKMCVVTDFVEGDLDPASHYTITHPSLARALGASNKWASPNTQCSNPFIEQGQGNAETNCIGCHQHAGTKANPEEIYLNDPENPRTAVSRQLYPNHSRSQVRHNFPGDYLWSFSQGPDYFESEIISTVNNVDHGI